MTAVTPDAALRRTPKHPVFLGVLLGCVLGQASVVALMHVPDRVIDVGVRLANKLHRR